MILKRWTEGGGWRFHDEKGTMGSSGIDEGIAVYQWDSSDSKDRLCSAQPLPSSAEMREFPPQRCSAHTDTFCKLFPGKPAFKELAVQFFTVRPEGFPSFLTGIGMGMGIGFVIERRDDPKDSLLRYPVR